MGQASQADPPVGAAIMPGEAADAATAPSPPDLLMALASTPVGAITDSPAGPPVTADVGMVEAPPPVVIPDLPVLGHEERAAVVAEVGDRRPAALAEERPSTSTVMVPDASTPGGPAVAELPELFQLKCLSPASEARPHLNGNNPSIPQI
jgi:hypothetical protein